MQKLSTLVLVLLLIGRFGPWLESLAKLHVWSLEFEDLAEKVPGNFKSGKINKGPHTIYPWQEWPI